MNEIIQAGWPEKKNGFDPALVHYFHVRDELTVEEGVVLRGERIVIPKSLRKETLEELHTAHQGVESTWRRAHESIYWPHMNRDIKEHISRCEMCTTFPTRQPKEPPLNYEVPNRPWEKIGTDLFQFGGKHYLVTVDYFSNFLETDYLSSTRLPTHKEVKKSHRTVRNTRRSSIRQRATVRFT